MRVLPVTVVSLVGLVGCGGLAEGLSDSSADVQLVVQSIQLSMAAVRPGSTLVTGQAKATSVGAMKDLLQSQDTDCSTMQVAADTTSVTADLGHACTLSGVDASGKVTVRVESISPATAHVTTDQLVVDGQAVEVDATATATSADEMHVVADVGEQDGTHHGDVTVTLQADTPPRVVLNGTVDSTHDGITTHVKLDHVTYELGGNEMQDGSITVTGAEVDPQAAAQ